jgi:hypothetical protein
MSDLVEIPMGKVKPTFRQLQCSTGTPKELFPVLIGLGSWIGCSWWQMVCINMVSPFYLVLGEFL